MLSRSDKTRFWARHAYLAKSRDKGFSFAADTSELGLLFVMTKHISPFGESVASSAPFWLLIVPNLYVPVCYNVGVSKKAITLIENICRDSDQFIPAKLADA